jgi:hypothetical protein
LAPRPILVEDCWNLSDGCQKSPDACNGACLFIFNQLQQALCFGKRRKNLLTFQAKCRIICSADKGTRAKITIMRRRCGSFMNLPTLEGNMPENVSLDMKVFSSSTHAPFLPA